MTEIFKGDTPCRQYNYAKASPRQGLLKSALLGSLKQHSVLETRLALLLNGTRLMSRQAASEVTGQLFID